MSRHLRRSRISVILLLIATLIVGCASDAERACVEKNVREGNQFRARMVKLQRGMSTAKVEQILGMPCTLCDEPVGVPLVKGLKMILSSEGKECRFAYKGVTLDFRDGKLCDWQATKRTLKIITGDYVYPPWEYGSYGGPFGGVQTESIKPGELQIHP